MQHFLSILGTPTEALVRIIERAIALRAPPPGGGRRPHTVMSGKTLACLFQKPSLRTRVSFEQAMRRLGGSAMSLLHGEVGIGSRESPEDVARVLSGMVDAVVARVLTHSTLERFAAVSSVPVINGLSDLAHPAQALADVLTMTDEFSPGNPRGLRGRTVAFVGDGNNVARSLAAACARLGMRFVMCAPPGYDLSAAWVERLYGQIPGAEVRREPRPAEAVRGADAVYCDTFVSMGQETERAERMAAFGALRVNDELLSHAPGHAIVMHCLPAHRGEEITDGVMDGPRSRVFRQAHNRLDAQMGLLAELIPGR